MELEPKDIVKKYQAQTFPYPSFLDIDYSKGSYIYDKKNKKYLDFVAGVSACSVGHSNIEVIKAVKDQIDKYYHVMVYGEYIQEPQYKLAKLLAKHLPKKLSTSYFTNSGAEAIEGAIKLAKRITSKSEIISCWGSYHGSTHGALSVMGNEHYKANYRPLLPECNKIIFNDLKSLNNITKKTAAVIIETVQGASGFKIASENFLNTLKNKCKECGALIIFDEIQTGYGRLGKLFGFEQTNIVPDILCIAKGMGGGMPIGAFISSWENMNNLTRKIKNKEVLFRKLLSHRKIKNINGKGLMLSIDLDSKDERDKLVANCMDDGLLLFYFLFNETSVRLTPPLTISNEEIIEGCEIIINNLENL